MNVNFDCILVLMTCDIIIVLVQYLKYIQFSLIEYTFWPIQIVSVTVNKKLCVLRTWIQLLLKINLSFVYKFF